jgi:two-component system, NarL family, sensor kinase
MGWIRNPVVQFLAVVVMMLVAVLFGTAALSTHAADVEAVSDARAVTRVLATSVAQPAVPPGLVEQDPAAVDQLDRLVLARLLVDGVRRIKIWDRSGRILYSDETRLIGSRYHLGADERRVFTNGTVEAEISDLSKPENRFEPRRGGLLEVYTRIRAPEGQPLLFEAYYSLADVAARRQRILDRFRPITVGALAVFAVLTTPLILLLTRRVRKSGQERERLLHSAIEASDAERVRIARDLHDGVVQDLAGSSFALATLARSPQLPAEFGERLAGVSRTLRTSMRSLRSLLVEIYPPELHAEGLEAALTDLLSPLAARGITTTLVMDDLTAVPEERVALLWRVAQECVRNALRHAGPTRVDVRVDVSGDDLALCVNDDGTGFDTAAVPAHHFGLRGLRSLSRDAGGRLEVRSAPGAGTSVRLAVPAR